jgi:uncharacterized protein
MADSSLPVTVVISRTPLPGREADLVEWAHGITAAAAAFRGHLGAQVYPPSPPDRVDMVLAFSFSDASALQEWEGSQVRRDWLQRAEALAAGEMRTHSVSGFEGIFSPTVHATASPPPRWKTATIIALALYPMSLLINWLLIPHIATWNLLLRVLVSTAIIVPYMAWLGVPYLTRWLRSWLHP